MLWEWLIGFDARERPRDLGELWPRERRTLFLLRTDVSVPLSVDTLVWPSLFDTGQGGSFPPTERARLHLAGLSGPLYTGPTVGLWENDADLRRYLSCRGAWARDPVIVAVTWFAEDSAVHNGHSHPYPAQPEPISPGPLWHRVGYDVADASRLSGLSNCGYGRDEARRLRATWAAQLNAAGLFDSLEIATRYCELANARVPEHAPFHVYGLYRL